MPAPIDDAALIAEIQAISGRLEGFANDLLKACKLLDLFMETMGKPGGDNDNDPGPAG
jgi:hypothetical protein